MQMSNPTDEINDCRSLFLAEIPETRRNSLKLVLAEGSAVARRVAKAEAEGGAGFADRGAVWTYLTMDRPFGVWTDRVLKRYPEAAIGPWSLGIGRSVIFARLRAWKIRLGTAARPG